MELKHKQALDQISTDAGFNRTFMELKPSTAAAYGAADACFNRTFMELKQEAGVSTTEESNVLIGPSWN